MLIFGYFYKLYWIFGIVVLFLVDELKFLLNYYWECYDLFFFLSW